MPLGGTIPVTQTKVEKELLARLKEFQHECKFPPQYNLPKVPECDQSSFTTGSDDSLKQKLPGDPRKMVPNPPLKPPKIQLTESYEGYF